MRRRRLLTVGLLALVCLCSACGKGPNAKIAVSTTAAVTTTAMTEATTETTEVTTEDPHKGQARSPLTGCWTEPDIAKQRPIALMINNIKVATPQSGIAKADVMYEILVEGGITRMMGIFENYKDIPKLGPVRSARHYYVEIAEEYNAIYMHYGQTKYAVSEMNQLGIDTLSGLSSIGDTVYFRDPNRKAPHNAYTSSKGIEAGLKQKQYKTTEKESSKAAFLFREKSQSLPDGKKAVKISTPFSSYAQPWFAYDAKNKRYNRFQFGGPQIDTATEKQLTYQNVIVQFVKEWDIDHNGYQTMELTGSGEGYYATRGTYEKITWEKTSAKSRTVYYGPDGKEIRLNPGKTWIAVFPRDRENLVVFQ